MCNILMVAQREQCRQDCYNQQSWRQWMWPEKQYLPGLFSNLVLCRVWCSCLFQLIYVGVLFVGFSASVSKSFHVQSWLSASSHLKVLLQIQGNKHTVNSAGWLKMSISNPNIQLKKSLDLKTFMMWVMELFGKNFNMLTLNRKILLLCQEKTNLQWSPCVPLPKHLVVPSATLPPASPDLAGIVPWKNKTKNIVYCFQD